MKNTLTILLILIVNTCLYSQSIYKFDSTANVYGCSNVFLQKISKNWQYELMIEISQIDSLPISKEFDLTNYSKYLTVYLNKYPKGNKYVHDICNDVFYANMKTYKPVKYKAKQGKILISKWNSEFVISLQLEDLILIDNMHNEIKLASEQFCNLQVGWMGG